MRLDVKTRLVGELLRRWPGASIASMTLDDIKARRRAGIPRNALTSRVMGRPAAGTEVDERILATEAGYLPARVYRRASRADDLPVVVHFHGGGWVLGDLDSGTWVCSHVAAATPAVVLSVDYCLAPERPFPAAVEECVAAIRWVAGHGHKLGGDPGRIAVMGDSAGANLAAVVAHQLRDAGGPELCHQTLIYPSTDATLGSPSIEQHADAILLSRSDIDAFLAHYLGDQDPKDPRVSPLHASDHADLPPALIQTAEHDPLRDDGSRYAEALREAGVQVRYTEYLGVPHGFVSVPGLARPAWQALREIVDELRIHLA
jgi:acetyl esterase/lipase